MPPAGWHPQKRIEQTGCYQPTGTPNMAVRKHAARWVIASPFFLRSMVEGGGVLGQELIYMDMWRVGFLKSSLKGKLGGCGGGGGGGGGNSSECLDPH